MPKKTIFLTGATGILGSYLFKIFLANGHKVFVLARPKREKSAQERVKDILDFWDAGASKKFEGKYVVLEGDITKPDLGFDIQARQQLKDEVEEIFHCAAATNLKLTLENVRRINAEGSHNVFLLAEYFSHHGKLVKTNHISTAFVFGDYKSEFNEVCLDFGQKFNTTYEQAKFEAEKTAHQFREAGLWIDIYRPPIIIGHSLSGKIFSFKNIYQLVQILGLEIFEELPVSNLQVNMVPVDIVAEAVYLISEKTKAKNKTYHPFSGIPVSVQEIINTASQLMAVKPIKVVSAKNVDLTRFTAAQKEILLRNIMALEFKAKLNCDYTLGLLKGWGFIVPENSNKILSAVLEYFIREKHLKKASA